MKIFKTFIEGLYILQTDIFRDKRGEFRKVFNDDIFKKNSINIDIKESYYTVSKKNVIRGMHFQIAPFEHTKIVYVSKGKILDVVLDMRKKSTTYGKYFDIELSDENSKILIIPDGLAHGFKSLKDNTIVNYMQTSVYSPKHDKGIRYDSFGFDWKCKNPIISDRDRNFLLFDKREIYF